MKNRDLEGLCRRKQLEQPFIEALREEKIPFPSLPADQHYRDFPFRRIRALENGFSKLEPILEEPAASPPEKLFSPEKGLFFSSRQQGQGAPQGVIHRVCMRSGSFSIDGDAAEQELEGIEFHSLEEAQEIYGSFMSARRQELARSERDFFAATTAALAPEGLFIYVEEGEHQVELVHILEGYEGFEVQEGAGEVLATSEGRTKCLFGKVEVYCAPRARLRLLYRLQLAPSLQEISQDKISIHTLIDCKVDEEARCKLFIDQPPLYAPDYARFLHFRGHCGAKAQLECEDLSRSSHFARNDLHIVLDGEGADAKVRGARLLSGQERFETVLLLEHRAPGCTSTQDIRSLVGGAASSSFEGKIYVHKEAQKTDAYQLSKALVIGEKAMSIHRPNLEIFADDVKASHGATTGEIDPELLFYLQARGLSRIEAKRLLIEGFIAQNYPEKEPLIAQILSEAEKDLHQLLEDYDD